MVVVLSNASVTMADADLRATSIREVREKISELCPSVAERGTSHLDIYVVVFSLGFSKPLLFWSYLGFLGSDRGSSEEIFVGIEGVVAAPSRGIRGDGVRLGSNFGAEDSRGAVVPFDPANLSSVFLIFFLFGCDPTSRSP